MAERLRAAVAAQAIHAHPAGPALQVTASFGVAVLEATHPVEESVDNADKALYQAKSAGRNRVRKSTH
jgi:diguanylate cyclase (GGDEF)-like protein